MNLLNENVPKLTTPRANLRPWISKETSHLIKKLDKVQQKNNNLATLSKIIKLHDEISWRTTENQLDYQTEMFSS